MKISDDLLEVAAEIELALHESESSKVNIEMMRWEAELLVYHFKSLIRNRPIGYMSVTGVENIHDCGVATVYEETDDKRVVPVYIQW
ncbi:hypothetical protein ACUII0_002525 [Providencia rettgeri]|uniref:hypothetical protein n=1 Tax=Providencia rettgeri TaxID=587 RepID=UPI002881637E|nr:hypothetical protein [Providencia rettgeri]MDK3108341.1 hypothetical protein [Providencia rettgeri]WRR95994.1 hypothetical protein VNI59_14655 [Providencia rettgeri]